VSLENDPAKKDDETLEPGAVTRLALKQIRREAAESAAAEAVKSMLEMFGCKTAEELQAKIAKQEAAPKSEPVAPAPNAEGPSELDQFQFEARLREDLLDAGIKRSALDYAVDQFKARLRTMDDKSLETFDVKDYVASTAKDTPFLFADGRLPADPAAPTKKPDSAPEPEKKTEVAAPAEPPKPATTGTVTPPGQPAPVPTQAKNYADPKVPKADVDARLRQLGVHP